MKRHAKPTPPAEADTSRRPSPHHKPGERLAQAQRLFTKPQPDAVDAVLGWVAGGTKCKSGNRASGRKGGAANRKAPPVALAGQPAAADPMRPPQPRHRPGRLHSDKGRMQAGAFCPWEPPAVISTPEPVISAPITRAIPPYAERATHAFGAWPLLDLGPGQCRFACTPHAARSHRFCGQPTVVSVGDPHGSWCCEHSKLVFSGERFSARVVHRFDGGF